MALKSLGGVGVGGEAVSSPLGKVELLKAKLSPGASNNHLQIPCCPAPGRHLLVFDIILQLCCSYLKSCSSNADQDAECSLRYSVATQANEPRLWFFCLPRIMMGSPPTAHLCFKHQILKIKAGRASSLVTA